MPVKLLFSVGSGMVFDLERRQIPIRWGMREPQGIPTLQCSSEADSKVAAESARSRVGAHFLIHSNPSDPSSGPSFCRVLRGMATAHPVAGGGASSGDSASAVGAGGRAAAGSGRQRRFLPNRQPGRRWSGAAAWRKRTNRLRSAPRWRDCRWSWRWPCRCGSFACAICWPWRRDR